MPRKIRRPNLNTILQQAEKAGRPVKSVVFGPDGGFTLVFGGDEVVPAASANPWDADLQPAK